MRWMIARENTHNIGIDVGWRVEDQDGNPHEIWWGNTKNEDSLRSLITDCRKQHPSDLPEFGLDESVTHRLTCG